MSFAIKGNYFFNFFGVKEEILGILNRKWTKKSTLFAKLAPVFWGSKMSYYGLFQSFFGIVYEVFGLWFGLKRPDFRFIYTSKG